jgi:glycosyltransferase involved in cell wall biosynthesis
MFDRIREAVPNVHVRIVGHSPPPEIQELTREPGIEVTGSVDDVRPYYSSATVFVVPLRLGGGTRLKIIEAMAMGLPVVSTSVGAEGLDLRDGQDILLADGPIPFADATIRLLTDPALRQTLAQNARQAAQQYDWDALAEPFTELVLSLASQQRVP